MSVSKLTVEISPADWQIARLTAIAVVLALLDAAIPSPLPGIKPGLANIVTLLVFGQFGLTVAAWVSILRVLVMAVLFGYMLTPTFFLSLMGALASLLVLAGISLLMKRFSSTPLSRCFGPVTISLLCSFAHTAGQLLLVRLWLIPHAGVYRLIPLYMLAAWIFGCCNGLVVAWLNRASAQT